MAYMCRGSPQKGSGGHLPRNTGHNSQEIAIPHWADGSTWKSALEEQAIELKKNLNSIRKYRPPELYALLDPWALCDFPDWIRVSY